MTALNGRAWVAVVGSRGAARVDADPLFAGARVANYEDAAATPEVQAVYIATPPSEHEAHALLAIAAGKAVLVEKPFALNGAAAARIAAAARAEGVFCMEAMWTRFQPLIGEVHRMIAMDQIGEVRQFYGAFCGADISDEKASMFDPARGGGALMYRGIYPLSLARYLIGPVTELQAMGRIGATGVDEDCALTLRHASGAISTVRASVSSNAPNGMVIQGTRGMIRVEPPIYRPIAARVFPTMPRASGIRSGRLAALRESSTAHAVWQRGGPFAQRLKPGGHPIRAPYQGNGYSHEAEALMNAVAMGGTESHTMPLDESVEIMRWVDSARAEWGGQP